MVFEKSIFPQYTDHSLDLNYANSFDENYSAILSALIKEKSIQIECELADLKKFSNMIQTL